MNFEDFVIKKTETINKIFDHGYDRLEINKVDFNLIEENNINLFKKELRNDEIVYIEKIKKYLYPF